MSGRQQTLLKILAVVVVLILLAVAFPVKPLPPIEGGPVEIFSLHVGDIEFPVSNSMLLSWIVTLVLIIVTYAATHNMKLVPSGLQNFMEMVVEALHGLVNDISGGRGKRFFPFVATIFLYIILSNWLGLLPGVGPIGIKETHMVGGHEEEIIVPLLRSPSADLNNTVALAIVSVLMTQVFAIMALGAVNYGLKWVNVKRLGEFFLALVGRRPRKGMGMLLFWGLIDIFVGLVELFSEVMKIVTFSFRLFGNVFAGEVILIVMAYLFAQFLPLPFYAFELFVGFIQAFVFAMLTLVFMSLATMQHGASEGHAAH
jgi:F-type H+-transporting ATPase subunit a